MAESSLPETAARLGSMYSELIRAGNKLDELTLPPWMEPTRLRPIGGFHLGGKVIAALSASPLYFSPLARGYEYSDTVTQANRNQYDADLRVFHRHLKPAVAQVANDGLRRMGNELRKLTRRFSRPGIENRLHESAVRIWEKNREVLSGGIEGPSPSVSEKTPQTTNESTEVLPGGVTYPNATQPKASPKSVPPTDFVERWKLLRALKAERQTLEGQISEALDPREARARDEVIEISNLLALIAVHPNAVSLVRAYVESPIKGTAAVLEEIEKAVVATQKLRERLTTRETKDDAWDYAPLVVGAVTQLRLQEVPGLPEFAVAMGRLLAMTNTKVIINAATVLVIGLSLFFTGPLGAVAVGTLDLALAGTDLGMTLLRMHEQEIAATATDFSPEDKKLAAHPDGSDAALSVAGAFLSAIALAGATKTLLKTRPRSPEILKSIGHSKGPPTKVSPPALGKASATNADDTARGVANRARDVSSRSVHPGALDEITDAEIDLAIRESHLVGRPPKLKELTIEKFDLTEGQEAVLGEFLGELLPRGAPPVDSSVPNVVRQKVLAASQHAADLRSRLRSHWDAALPPSSKSPQNAALDVYQRVANRTRGSGKTDNKFVRDVFFKAWRNRFKTRVANDPDLLSDMRKYAGITFNPTPGKGINSFSVPAIDVNKKRILIGLDVDHAVIRHENAVDLALKTNDPSQLVSTVDSSGLQFILERENENVIDVLRKDSLKWPAPAAAPLFPISDSVNPEWRLTGDVSRGLRLLGPLQDPDRANQ